MKDNFDYQDLIKENIYIAKLLYNLPENKKEKIMKLLFKKKKIQEKNGFLAEIKIQKINNKINKIRKDSNEKETFEKKF